MIEFVTGALLTDLGVEYHQNETPEFIEERKRDIISMREYARVHKLDTNREVELTAVMDRMEKIEEKLARLATFEAKLDVLIQKLT